MVEICRWPKASLSVSLTACMRDAEPAGALRGRRRAQRAGRRPAPPTTTSRNSGSRRSSATSFCDHSRHLARRRCRSACTGTASGSTARRDLHVLHRLEIDRHAGDRRRRAASAASITAATSSRALAARLQRDHQAADIGGRVDRARRRSPRRRRSTSGSAWIAAATCACRLCISANETSGPASVTAVIEAGVLQRQEALRRDDVEDQTSRRCVANVTQQRRALALQHPQQRAVIELDHAVDAAADCGKPGDRRIPRRACFSSREHIIGVSVSETTAEITTAMVRVSANSRNMRPTSPVMNSSGMNTAISDTVSEITVKPISLAPFERRLHRRSRRPPCGGRCSRSSRWRRRPRSRCRSSAPSATDCRG